VAITACLTHTRLHRDTSTEFHTETGPFTLVPLLGDRSSLVWVAEPAEAARDQVAHIRADRDLDTGRHAQHQLADVARLRQVIVSFFEESMTDEELVVPYDRQRLVGEIYEEARVLSETYDERGACFRVRALPATLARLRRTLGE